MTTPAPDSPAVASRTFLCRADLLRALQSGTEAKDLGNVARLGGFGGFSSEVSTAPKPGARRSNQPRVPESATDAAPVREPAREDERRVRFWQMASRRKREAIVASAPPVSELLTAAELVAPAGRREPVPPTLQPWKRLEPFLRRALGRTLPGRELDVERATDILARLKMVHDFPRRRWLTWADQMLLVWDRRHSFSCFRPDMLALRRQLARYRGRFGMRVAKVVEPQRLTRLTIPAGAPILLLSDLGGLGSGNEITEQWIRTGIYLRRRGHRLTSLLPLATSRWPVSATGIWAGRRWDRGRLESKVDPRSLEEVEGVGPVETLLSLLAGCVHIRPGMIRSLRCLLPTAVADAEVEWRVWNHPDIINNGNEAAFRPERSAVHRDRLLELDPDLVRRAIEELRAWHQTLSPHYWHAFVRNMDRAGMPMERPELTLALQAEKRETESLAQLAQKRDIRVGEQTGLPLLMGHQLARMAPRDRASEIASKNMARIISYWNEPVSERLPGFDDDILEAELNRLLGTSGPAKDWWIQADNRSLFFGPDPTAAPHSAGSVPLGQLTLGHPRLTVTSTTPGQPELTQDLLLSSTGGGLAADGESTLSLRADHSEVTVHCGERPSWASRMGQDRWGLYADLELAEGVPLRLRWIPPGEFLMGSPSDEAGRFEREGPRHSVAITCGYWLAQTQVTQAQWGAIMPENPSKILGDDRPVESVTWAQCREFCAGLAERWPELVFDLPTEAEWEYACRAGTSTAYDDGSDVEQPEGSDPGLNRLGWYRENSQTEDSHGATHPVGQKAANAWGLRDMHGNVFEWCLDWLGDYAENKLTDPEGPEMGGVRVVRGGSWADLARNCRSAYRAGGHPFDRLSNLGFRLAAGQELQLQSRDEEKRAGAEAGRDAPLIARPMSGVRRPRSWAQHLERDECGVRLEFRIKNCLFVWRWIPRGSFLMGSPEGEAGRYEDEGLQHEGPQHEVEISRGYWLAATPVTQSQWQAVMGNNPSNFKGEELPTEGVDWEGCCQYAETLNTLLPGLGARLPSEAEWEYACRAGTTAAFNSGADCKEPEGIDPALGELGWYNRNSGNTTHDVRQKHPNGWGLYDMHGNVWEWCQDGWGEYSGESAVDPLGPDFGVSRVVRGGSWADLARDCRSAFRFRWHPSDHHDDLGFRLAAGPEIKKGTPGGARAAVAEAGRDDPLKDRKRRQQKGKR